ncbi:MAG: PAS domain-containing protein [Acetatifactor sp.]|nr:PAS domain-containing protein [Acetatifactor sp.]
MVKNRNIWFLAGAGVTGFSICMLLGLMCFRQLCVGLDSDMRELAVEDFLPLTLSMLVGFGILMVCACGIMRVRHMNLYLENQLTHAIMDSGYSMFLEYCDKTKEQRWLGDVKHVFKAKEGNLDLEQLVHPEDLPLLDQQMEDVRRGRLYSVDVRLKDVEGKYRICSFQMIPIHAVLGRHTRILGIVQDVDVERRRTLELVEERNQLRCYLADLEEYDLFSCFSMEKAIHL